MSDSSPARRKVAGYNQFAKLIRRGKAVKVYLASDADRFFIDGVKRELKGCKNIELVTRHNSDELAKMAGVDVPTAVITEIKEEA